jgi:hypothetical protein
MVWDQISKVYRDDVVFGEGPLPGWCYCADSIWAKVIIVVIAVAEMATFGTGLDCPSLSSLDDFHSIVH